MTNNEKRDQLWRHFVSWLPAVCFRRDQTRWDDYDPEPWRDAFFRFQTHGESRLNKDELDGIWPLICAQKNKEITLNSIVLETMEWDASGWCWFFPLRDILSRQLEPLTRLALTKIHDALDSGGGFGGRCEWYMKHPVRTLNPSEFSKHLVKLNQRFGI